jgi:hypothetical protein
VDGERERARERESTREKKRHRNTGQELASERETHQLTFVLLIRTMVRAKETRISLFCDDPERGRIGFQKGEMRKEEEKAHLPLLRRAGAC